LQGNRILIASSQNLSDSLRAKPLEVFSVNADLCCFLLLEQVESDVAQNGKFSGLIFADAA